MLLSNKKALSSLEIVQEIWPEELEDKDEPGKKVKQLVYRLRQAFSIISDEQLILSTPSGYQFNPDLHITTDFQRFDELCIAAAKATSAINKVRLLEKAASLYQGKLLSAANGEHWLVHYANRYHLAFMSTVNELLKQLMDFHAYDLLHRDAALALDHRAGKHKSLLLAYSLVPEAAHGRDGSGRACGCKAETARR